ncbi:MAG: NAD(P)(+) transhydrogenase (Re/Si-specific) subunit beta [Deltaproteobacteria bacterium]|nr:NAD(P)(+) transhydrogenase (Re/Si-specific) subunit beta [Deltaproteobacteria bacterium]
MTKAIIELGYLIAAVLFVVGLKQLSSVETARRGNLLGAVGMLIAIVITLVQTGILQFSLILLGLVVGSAVGLVMALKTPMTGMPQMVALLNGFGGAASTLVATSEYVTKGTSLELATLITVALSVLVGAVTFTGSVIAFAKLQEWMPGRPILFKFQNFSNLFLFLLILAVGVYFLVHPDISIALHTITVGSLLLGVMLVLPIGGADMPVVISLLNSYSGIAAALTGFVLSNHGLIITGALVGSSGIILSQLMCKAMNRSLANVLFGGFGQVAVDKSPGKPAAARPVRECSVEDAVLLLENAQLVIVVPGYGMAVSQAQRTVAELAEILEKKGVTVKYAIHPVAGRMPGHMNILLAEANVPYDQLYEMDTINPEFESADVALVVGANDVTNPAAREDSKSPIYGMPILDTDKAKTVIVCKRSMNPGFAGIDNELYYRSNTCMLFGDAKASLNKVVAALK